MVNHQTSGIFSESDNMGSRGFRWVQRVNTDNIYILPIMENLGSALDLARSSKHAGFRSDRKHHDHVTLFSEDLKFDRYRKWPFCPKFDDRAMESKSVVNHFVQILGPNA
jgi:hypothetical protein